MLNRKSPGTVIQTRSIKLKDEMQNSNGNRNSIIHSNFGTIMNYTKMEGVNDKTRNDSFRKWTGMP